MICWMLLFVLTTTCVSAAATPASDLSILPTAVRHISVSSQEELEAAIKTARPGEHIILEDGEYGELIVTCSGRQGEPVIVRARNTLGAKVTKVEIQGHDAWVIGVDVINGGAAKLTGARGRISSSRFHTPGTAIQVTASATGSIVDHNEIASQATPQSEYWDGILMTQNTVNMHVFRNYLYGANAGKFNEAIVTSHTTSVRTQQTGNIIEYNLIENWHNTRAISTKSGGNIIRFNTCIDANEIVNRSGVNNHYIANWIEGDLRIHDEGQVIIGNKVIGGTIRVASGNQPPATPDYIPAKDTLVVGNDGILEVGFNFAASDIHPAVNTRIEAHKGQIKLGRHVGTTISEVTDMEVPTPIKLTPADVGPFAPTAPRSLVMAYAELQVGNILLPITAESAEYVVRLPFGLTAPPEIKAVSPEELRLSKLMDPAATVQIRQAAELPGEAVVEVADADGKLLHQAKIRLEKAPPAVDFLFDGTVATEAAPGALLHTVKDNIAIGLKVDGPDWMIRRVDLELVPIVMGDKVESERRTLYSGNQPVNAVLDVYAVEDGTYELHARLESIYGHVSERSATLLVDAWTELNDELEPPVETWFFGLMQRNKTVRESAGWQYATDQPEAFFGDSTRRVRSAAGPGPEFLIWEAAGLWEFELVVYTRDVQVEKAVELAVSAAASADDQSWQVLPYVCETAETSAAGWQKQMLRGRLPDAATSAAVKYFRFTISEGYAPGDIQLGRVILIHKGKK
ncbi:MAG TPA: hypothetical protein GXX29_04145 [Firmicutes bacterium]|nr:hypothetical protein [Bacillota bacterium]